MIFWIGLGAVSLPIIIHLLNRRRFRLRQWAAMQFLLDSLKRNRRRLQIEELILMALRCLVLFLLALAIARFTGCGDRDLMPGAQQAPETTIFILDDSFSMDQKIGVPTLLTNAIEDVTSHIKRLSENAKSDKVAVILTSEPKFGDIFQETMPVAGQEEIDQLIARIQAIEPKDSPAKLGPALATAERMLAGEDKPKNVLIYSDFRAVDLGRGKAGQYQEAFKALRQQEANIVALDYGRTVNANLTVEKIELMDKWALAGVPARVGVTIRNNGEVRLANVQVGMSARWRADGKEDTATFPAETIVTIEADSSARLEFTVTLPVPGSAALTVETPSDHLAGDNKGYLALNVRKSLRILLVDGHPDMTDPAMSEAYRLALLLDPQKNTSHGNEVTVVTSEAVGAQNFRDYDLVVLLDVAKLPSMLDPEGKVIYPLLMSLEEYVRQGGGLAIFTGSNLNLAFYNGPMYAEGLGLSPLVISPPRGDAAAKEKYRRIDARSVAGDSFLRSLRGEGGAIRCAMVRFYAHTPSDPMTASAPSGEIKPPRIVARFTAPDGGDGPPAIVFRQFGKGAAMMMYSTASTRWNDWADDEPESAYSAPMLDMMMHLARSQGDLYTGSVGESIVHTIDRQSRDAGVTMRTPRFPADELITLTTIEDGSPDRPRRVVKYDNPTYAGCYTMSLKMPDASQSDLFFARTVDPDEGNLQPGGRKLIVRAMGSDDFKYVSREAAGSTADVQTKDQKEYWLALLIALLVLLTFETFLARRFGHYSSN